MQVVVLEWDVSSILGSSMLCALSFIFEASRLGRWCWWKEGGPFSWTYKGYDVITKSVVAMKTGVLA